VLWYVTDGKIDRIGSLSTKLGELGFVRGYYDGDDGAIFATGCSLNLFLAGKDEVQRTMAKT
jgi:hypothetical protein